MNEWMGIGHGGKVNGKWKEEKKATAIGTASGSLFIYWIAGIYRYRPPGK